MAAMIPDKLCKRCGHRLSLHTGYWCDGRKGGIKTGCWCSVPPQVSSPVPLSCLGRTSYIAKSMTKEDDMIFGLGAHHLAVVNNTRSSARQRLVKALCRAPLSVLLVLGNRPSPPPCGGSGPVARFGDTPT